ncbi:MAG: phosphoribosyl transferase, partial [Acidobacteriota bacterium]
VITDDGVATGLTMLAAIREIKARKPSKIVLAVPVIPNDLMPVFKTNADEIVALEAADAYLGSVGAYYKQFDQTSDEEVIELMSSMKMT